MQSKIRRTHRGYSVTRILDSWVFLFAAAIIFIFLAVAVGKEAWRSYKVSSDLQKLDQEIADLQKQNNQLGDLVTYLNSSAYQETAAKDRLGLKKQGERVVALPDVTTTENGVTSSGDVANNSVDASESSKPNVVKWWDYYFAPKKINNNS